MSALLEICIKLSHVRTPFSTHIRGEILTITTTKAERERFSHNPSWFDVNVNFFPVNLSKVALFHLGEFEYKLRSIAISILQIGLMYSMYFRYTLDFECIHVYTQ